MSEAIAAGLPIFTHRPVPGQERGNAEYLASKGAATITASAGELVRQITELLDDPQKLEQARWTVFQLQTANAAEHIAHDILNGISYRDHHASTW
ncbi:hypothetical protein [Paenibacillus protaetiae]|uniref:hypothetical protein n=1 Tax=Paenibacillus protaetiae TaxID=2509456 RepID=UPI003CC57137